MIPVENIFYMLLYVWQKPEYIKKIKVQKSFEKIENVNEFWSLILLFFLEKQTKLGFSKIYNEKQEITSNLRGKIDFKHIPKNFCKWNCFIDEFELDYKKLEILKAALKVCLESNISKKTYYSLKKLWKELEYINLIDKKNLNLNLEFKEIYLNICILILKGDFIKKGKNFFIQAEDLKMEVIFEKFIRNFYKKNLKDAKVSRENINWKTNVSDSLLPRMQTDISITWEKRKMIIDTKWYKKTLNESWNTMKIHSQNLYQIFAYLKNSNQKTQGMLLYPKVIIDIEKNYCLDGNFIRVSTINLNQEWSKIEKELLEKVRPFN